MSIAEHSREWYSDIDSEDVVHIHLTTDNTEIGSYEPAGSGCESYRTVVRSTVRPFVLVTSSATRVLALLTILSRWGLN
jgi:aspartyl aminopeptidase